MEDDEFAPRDQPQPKRQRVLACRRCRHRKQRCDELRPCLNCRKSGDECMPTDPAPRSLGESQYVKALERRVAELETLDPRQSQDHMDPRPSSHEANREGEEDEGRRNARPHPPQPPGKSSAHEDSSSGRKRSSAEDLCGAADAAHSPGLPAPPRPPNHSREPASRTAAWMAEDDADADIDHMIFGLVTSPSVPRDDNSELSPQIRDSILAERLQSSRDPRPEIGLELEEFLLGTYRERAQAQYPFFHWDTYLAWHACWNGRASDLAREQWQGFFVNLVYASALLLLSTPRIGRLDAQTFYRKGVAFLPHVFAQPNLVLHVQAYLLLSIHALHRSSTGRILSLVSTTMRYCVQQQFHLSETEPEPTSPAVRLENQTRRRCFWCSYKLDRLAMSSFDLPPSVPDAMINTRVYSNINDHELFQVANETPPDLELPDSLDYTCVSSSLHILQCRRIQSEISAVTLRTDYASRFEKASDWRVRVLAELESYKSRVQKFSDPQSKGYTSQRWLAMIYHYTLLMLYRPTKESVTGPAGDWSVQASSQACLIFRKTQMDRQIAQPWLGLLVQFQSGVTLLYCFWATPPADRTDNYDSPDVPDAIRACSNILAIMADRWPIADCLRDVFELLAREVPLVDRPNRPPSRLSEKSTTAIRDKLPQVRSLMVHRSILRMIEEMVSEDFPRPDVSGQLPRLPPVAYVLAPTENTGQFLNRPGARDISPSQPPRSYTGTPSAMLNFELPFSAEQIDHSDGTGADSENLSAGGFISFPGVFDHDAWQ